jgi:hypothetical protein
MSFEHPTRQDTARVTLKVQNPSNGNWVDYGVWDKKTGGEVDSEDYKYKPGGMVDQISLGGTKTTGDVTLTRLYQHNNLKTQALISWVGRAECIVAHHILDVDGNTFGAPIVYRGKLKTLTPPEVDSESTDPAFIELVISPNSPPVIS